MKRRCSKWDSTLCCLNLCPWSYRLQFFQTDTICKEAKYFWHWYNIVWVLHKRSSHACNLHFVSRISSAFHKNHTCYVNKVWKFHTPHFFLNYFPTVHIPPCFSHSLGYSCNHIHWMKYTVRSKMWTESPSNFHFCSVTYKYFLIIFWTDKLGGKRVSEDPSYT